ncbi:MAG: hypothetical protein Q8Q95_02775 [bacterium]|nr:hypothetical protein [bacterium]
MPAKKTTIEDLARMVARGFNSVESKITSIENKMATKEQLDKVEKHLGERIDNIEKIILKQQGEQIKGLERRVNRLEEMFAVK